MNIKTKLDKINFDIKDKKNELYEQCKLMSGVIKGSLSTKNKGELKEILSNLKKYKENIDDEYKIFKFGNNKITLDEEQLEVVKCNEKKNMRVIACPGSGKTTTILCRCKYLIENYILPSRILLLTFNVDACENMVKRANELFGFEINIEIRTIDSFCSSIIWKYKTMENHNQSINYFNDKNTSLSEMCLEGEQVMLKYGNIISKNYEHVMFDEFQDANDTQFNILKIFEKNGCTLTIIGDESQSIYQWRGSNIYYIINMEKIININTFKITNNYRSSKHIIKCANKCIKNNKIRVDKNMKYLRDNGKKIKLILKKTVYEQCNLILELIDNKIKAGLKYHDIIILSRNSMPLKIIETYFERNGISYIASITEKNTAYDEKIKIIKENHITVSTIHKTKGLEWDTVIMLGLSDIFMPSHMNNNIKNIEEERRLFYVAVTRAKNDLLLIGSSSDVPVSRFVKELGTKYVDYELDVPKGIFSVDDTNIPKLKYTVTELISLFQGIDIKELRKMDLIPNEETEERLLFDKVLETNDKIKENFFESDFGEFCDRVLTRQIMLSNGQDLRDIDTELLINGINLTEMEMKIYQKYKMEKLIQTKNYNKADISEVIKDMIEDTNDLRIALQICSYVKENIEFRRINTYPDSFIKQLMTSYKKYLNKENKNSEIMKDIYFISLTRKILNERRRLIYRDIYSVFMKDFDEINDRMNEYAELYESKKTECKMHMRKMYKIDKNNVVFSGELDMYNKEDEMIVDFKCSNSDYKVEWVIQVMIYSALLIEGGKLDRNNIKYICIFNILKGKEYVIKIPEKYDYDLLLKYVGEYLKKELKSENYKTDMENDKYNLKTIIKEENEINKLNKINGKFKKPVDFDDNDKIDFSNIKQKECKNGNYMSVDVETGTRGVTSDIIQLSYIIYDKNHKEIKRYDQYVKDRMVDNFLFGIHKISSDHLKEKGIDFKEIMQEFIKDMNNCELVLGHNVVSDIKHIRSNIEKYGVNIKYDVFENKEVLDTMKIGKQMYNLNKNPNLTELVRLSLNKNMNNAHNSLYDCIYTAECYQKMTS
jgi:DNA polymerase III epsilon subunit-like protein